uniref:Uncharacterized protein n=1 Tax=viral metagenome TaxID=1070528 RepID=A0A6C0JYQ7_9ZZZZ
MDCDEVSHECLRDDMEIDYELMTGPIEHEPEISDEEKHQNFKFILKTIQSIESGVDINESWMLKHSKKIKDYRSWVSNYEYVNIEVEEPEFRMTCRQMELCIRSLFDSVLDTNTFDVSTYYTFNKCVQTIMDKLITADELADVMSSLCL